MRIVTGHANDGGGAQARTRSRDIGVVFTEMHAGSADGHGEFDIVVDDQRHGMAGTQRHQRTRLIAAARNIASFIAVLKQGCATVYCRRAGSDQIRAWAVADCIQAVCGQQRLAVGDGMHD